MRIRNKVSEYGFVIRIRNKDLDSVYDFGKRISNDSKCGFGIRIQNNDSGFRLRVQNKDSDYRFRIRFRDKDSDSYSGYGFGIRIRNIVSE